MVLIFAVAMTTSLAGVAVVLPLLRRAQVMDLPNARSSHTLPTPRGGGLAVTGAICSGLVAAALLGHHTRWSLVLGVLVFAAMGMVDDVRSLSATSRLLTQVVVACGVAAFLLGDSEFGIPTLLVVGAGSLWLVGYTNAFNFMDGINGISALSAFLAGLWYLYVGASRDIDTVAVLGVVVAGSALGFLPWNAPRARVFLGDVGSYALGLAIGGTALVAWREGVSLVATMAPLAIYLADTGWALLRRVLGRRPWREAHREHVYQRMADIAASHLTAAALATLFGASLCLIVAVGLHEHSWMVCLTVPLVVIYLSMPRLTGRRHDRQIGAML